MAVGSNGMVESGARGLEREEADGGLERVCTMFRVRGDEDVGLRVYMEIASMRAFMDWERYPYSIVVLNNFNYNQLTFARFVQG